MSSQEKSQKEVRREQGQDAKNGGGLRVCLLALLPSVVGIRVRGGQGGKGVCVQTWKLEVVKCACLQPILVQKWNIELRFELPIRHEHEHEHG